MLFVSFCFMVQNRGYILTKEKDELIKEKQALSKQMEDLRSSISFGSSLMRNNCWYEPLLWRLLCLPLLGKKPTGETASEQAMKEKEREKDTRIQVCTACLFFDFFLSLFDSYSLML